jgi:hypothetical protein
MLVFFIKSPVTQGDAKDGYGKWVFRSFLIKLNVVVISVDLSAFLPDYPSISWSTMFNKLHRK